MKWINLKLLYKLPTLRHLLQNDRGARVPRVTAHSWPGQRPDVKPLPKDTAWHPFPNIREFRIKLGSLDWLLLIFGFKRRYPPELEFWGWQNSEANRYLRYMFRRIRKQAELGLMKEAFQSAWILMNSKAYQLASYNHVMANWHRTGPVKEVKKHLREIRRLASERATDLDFKRTYIPKGNGGSRPLGVPTVPWRVYLHMYNNILVTVRLISEGNKQHAYLPGRGLITAWEILMDRLTTAPHIYEADFKGFFDNVDLQALQLVLQSKLGIPKEEAQWIWALNRSIVTLREVDEIPEPDRIRRYNLDGTINRNWLGKQGQSPEMLHPDIPLDLMLQMMREDMEDLDGVSTDWIMANYETVYAKYVELQAAYLASFEDLKRPGGSTPESSCPEFPIPKEAAFPKEHGVPQGAPTSCSLSTVALKPLEERADVLLYADDVIYFPPNTQEDPNAALELPDLGVRVNPEKSKWIKKNGEWVVDSFRFLGLRYFPPRQELYDWRETLFFVLLFGMMDVLTTGLPLLFALSLIIVILNPRKQIKERFTADTRKGATLEFGDRESFMSYLSNAREGLLTGGSSATAAASRLPLHTWLTGREAKWLMLKSKVGLLFRSPLKGYFISRMQSDSWDLTIEQNFKLRPKPGSWVLTRWPLYSARWNLPKKRLNIFVASSFACHDMLNQNWSLGVDSSKAKGRSYRIRRLVSRPVINGQKPSGSPRNPKGTRWDG